MMPNLQRGVFYQHLLYIISLNNTHQGYARKRTLKLVGYLFFGARNEPPQPKVSALLTQLQGAQFYEIYQADEKVAALLRQLS